jgi:hypothetical protein
MRLDLQAVTVFPPPVESRPDAGRLDRFFGQAIERPEPNGHRT